MTQDEVNTLLGVTTDGGSAPGGTTAPVPLPLPVGVNAPNPAAAAPPLPAPSTLEDKLTPRPITETSYKQLPSHENDGELHDPAPSDTMMQRVGNEMVDTYRNTPDFFTPEGLRTLHTMPGGSVIGPAAGVLNAFSPLYKGLTAAGAGLTANVAELAGGGDPQKVRDAHAMAQILPIMLGATPGVPPDLLRTPLGPKPIPLPLKPADVTPPGPAGPAGPSSPINPMSPTYAPPRVPVTTPEQAQAFIPPLVKTIQGDQTQITPGFTTRFADSVQDLGPQTPAQVTQERNLYPQTTILRNNIDAMRQTPMTSVQDIWNQDKIINDAVRSSYTRDGATPDTPKLLDIQRAWRAQLGDMQPGDTTGGTGAGLDALQQFRQTYQASAKMQDVQNIVDAAMQRDNPATSIKSGIATFLRDDRNTRGWSDTEKDALSDAGERGTVMEYLRASASRLGAQGAGLAGAGLGGWFGGLGGAFVGKELGTAVDAVREQMARKALTDAAVAKVQNAQTVLGQGVPQPGTAPPGPSAAVPNWVNRGARMLPYAPQTTQPYASSTEPLLGPSAKQRGRLRRGLCCR